MKKALKILFISLASLFLLIVMTISVALWFVFTPEKLTPKVQEQAQKYVTCEVDFQSVELTFFSTYPNFGIKINQIKVVNPISGSPNDTLLALNELTGVIDFKAWWKNDEIILKEALLANGTVNIFYDSLGNSNYDIFASDSAAVVDTIENASSPLNVEIGTVQLADVNLIYVDHTMPMIAMLNSFTGTLSGNLENDILHLNVDAENSIVSLVYDNEPYLQVDTLELGIEFDYWMDHLKMDILAASGRINEMPIAASGLIEEDTVTADLVFDLSYQLSNSTLEKILPMVPPSYQSYFDGVSANGSLKVDGSIKGIMNDSIWPLFYVGIDIKDAQAKYDGVPLELKDINAQVELVTDATTDEQTYMNIIHLAGKTNSSSFETKGKVNQLFSDIYCNLNSKFDLSLGELNGTIPGDMKLNMNGKAAGQIRSAFTLSQLEKSQYDKIDVSGSIALSAFEAQYDTLWVNGKNTKIDFALPNKKNARELTSFIKLFIETDELQAGSKDNYSAYLGKTSLAVETSNVLDSTRIPDVVCSFNTDSLAAKLDTISCTISMPTGKMVVSPTATNKKDPHIVLALKSGAMNALMGSDNARMKKLELRADVTNDSKQKDMALQWLAKGFVQMEAAHIETSMLTVPLDIPMISMDFDPENFNIKESKLVVDKSDFQLKGELNNIHSFFKGDSILRGKFNFMSDHTDINQLMALTNGLGSEEPADSAAIDSTSSGPYMVPKGVDVTLTTNVKSASYGTGMISSIKGDVTVRDGILTLDDLKLTTPATRIQMTAIYRTPRKNHLYLGLDYHMLDIEIEKLLTMVPDIDSIMPMLRSFKGKGEYHMAIETYLDSLYNLKKSTLRGAASITGQDLVLMDGETFSEIAKALKFNKKTENRVDSLSAEFTIFKNEIDVYPFLIVVDKYKAIVAGRHNLDMSFDYHISIVDSPLPIKLGVDVKGTLDDLSYRLAPCRYAEGYRPFARRTVESKQLELRKMIKESLVQKVER